MDDARKPKGDAESGLAAVVIGIAVIAAISLVNAHIYVRLWDWMVEPQYGPGPSVQSWYGITLMLNMSRIRKLKESDENVLRRLAHSVIDLYVQVGILVVAGFVAAWYAGW